LIAAAAASCQSGTLVEDTPKGWTHQGPEWSESPGSVSAPLLLMPPTPQAANRETKERKPRPIPRRSPLGQAALAGADPVRQVQGMAPSMNMPGFNLNFDAIGAHFTGFSVTIAPPDTNGDVGPNHYVQVVNSSFIVYNKSGARLYGPVETKSLFQGFTGGTGMCASRNDGDAVVLYDQLADRWFITQLAFADGEQPPYYQCVAVSTSPDPTSSYTRYAFGPYTAGGVAAFNDYGKFAVWPDGYYATFNMYNPSFAGSKLCAYDRSQMLAGLSATQQCFQLFYSGTSGGYGGVLPTHLYGKVLPPLPPAGAPHVFVGDDNSPSSVVQFWKMHVDWLTPANTRLTDIPANCPAGVSGPCPELVTVASFQLPSCGINGCVPQMGGSDLLDVLADRLMFRSGYRNFPGDHESLVFSRTVKTGGVTAVRWYEFRNGASTLGGAVPALHQQGTYSPPDGTGNWRWMSSIAMDQSGDIGLGYSLSGPNSFPSIALTGRRASDPLNTLPEAEAMMVAGGGYQMGTRSRWGDYSSMSVDPSDDCTFWYTTEYIQQTGSFNWDTRIANFKYPSCAASVGRYIFSTLPPLISTGIAVSVDITALTVGGAVDSAYNGHAQLFSNDPRAVLPTDVAFSSGVARGVSVIFRTAGHRTLWAVGVDRPSLTGFVSTTITDTVATSLAIQDLPTAIAVGRPSTFSVVALDSSGNVAGGYIGTVTIRSSDTAAQLPGDQTVTSGRIAGVPITFGTQGNQTLTARDPATGFSATANIRVTSAQLVFANLPASFTTYVPASFDLRALTLTGALDPGYQGTVAISSNDPQGSNPPNATFVNGVAAGLSIRLLRPGTTRIDAHDIAVPSLAASASVTVVGSNLPISPPAARVTSPQSGTTVGASQTLTADAATDPRTSVVSLEFLVDGASIGSSPSAPATITWDTKQVPDGPHLITARATDSVGGIATSMPVGVNVQNGASPSPPASHGCSATATSPDGLTLALLGLLRILASRKRQLPKGRRRRIPPQPQAPARSADLAKPE
jgi:hypothetical protein